MLLAGFVMAAPAALAVSPHFVSAVAQLSRANLVVSFKEAGLGVNQLASYAASADATAICICVNNGGANPSTSNKTTVSGPVTASGAFSSGKNGSVTASLTLSPPAPPPSTFCCPKGEKGPELAQVSYTSVTITDETNGSTEPIPGTFSACVLPNVRGRVANLAPVTRERGDAIERSVPKAKSSPQRGESKRRKQCGDFYSCSWGPWERRCRP
jgi:hypothetical protein